MSNGVSKVEWAIPSVTATHEKDGSFDVPGVGFKTIDNGVVFRGAINNLLRTGYVFMETAVMFEGGKTVIGGGEGKIISNVRVSGGSRELGNLLVSWDNLDNQKDETGPRLDRFSLNGGDFFGVQINGLDAGTSGLSIIVAKRTPESLLLTRFTSYDSGAKRAETGGQE